MANFTQELKDYLDRQPPGFLQQDRSYGVIATATAFIVLETVATILRIVARRLKGIPFMRADALMALSLVFNLGICTAIIRKLGLSGAKSMS
jgi:hypothetical protein